MAGIGNGKVFAIIGFKQAVCRCGNCSRLRSVFFDCICSHCNIFTGNKLSRRCSSVRRDICLCIKNIAEVSTLPCNIIQTDTEAADAAIKAARQKTKPAGNLAVVRIRYRKNITSFFNFNRYLCPARIACEFQDCIRIIASGIIEVQFQNLSIIKVERRRIC